MWWKKLKVFLKFRDNEGFHLLAGGGCHAKWSIVKRMTLCAFLMDWDDDKLFPEDGEFTLIKRPLKNNCQWIGKYRSTRLQDMWVDTIRANCCEWIKVLEQGRNLLHFYIYISQGTGSRLEGARFGRLWEV